MTLISILLALALEYFLGPLDRFRNFHWFEDYQNWLEVRCQRTGLWDGAIGVLLTVGLPVAVLLVADLLLGGIFIGLSFVLSILVFVYCLGPDLNILLGNYTQALEGNIEEDVAVIESELGLNRGEQSFNEEATVSAILGRAHDYVFGVLFWFIILGMAGALLYTLTLLLRKKYEGIHGGYAAAVADLYRILIWPSTRLLAIACALSGSLVDTLERWRGVEGESLGSSENILIQSGLGALQFEETLTENNDEAKAGYIQWVREAQALINRCLIIWLTVLGLMTLGGILT